METQTVNPEIIAPQQTQELAQRPVFGELMRLIHPFDFYEIVADRPVSELGKTQVGLTGIPVQVPNDQCYLSSAYIHRIHGQLYCVTTTVPAKTKNIV